MQNIKITTECVADLPAELVEQYQIGIIYYTVKTDRGEFRDTDEITATNVMEYMMGGEKKALSVIPSQENYKAFFKEQLETAWEIIHISISSSVSAACDHAMAAAKDIDPEGCRIHVIDSRHLSSGQGLLVLTAAKMKEEGKSSHEIAEVVTELIPKVSTSFLAYNADYLYYNDKVSKTIMDLCRDFRLHPVLSMVDGKLTVRKVYIGHYGRAAKRYVHKVLSQSGHIRKDMGFVTYAGCSNKNLEEICNEVQKKIDFAALYEQPASASISCNCGPHTFGVLYIRK